MPEQQYNIERTLTDNEKDMRPASCAVSIKVPIVGPDEEHFHDNKGDRQTDILLQSQHAVSVFITDISPGQTQNNINKCQKGIELR